MKVAFYSVTGQTRRFVAKLQEALSHLEVVEIDPNDPQLEMDKPFILIVPTYDAEVTEPIWEMLAIANNRKLCCGVIGGGNRNFADLFVYTAKDLSKDFNLPLIYAFEFSGTHEDITFVKNWMKNYEP